MNTKTVLACSAVIIAFALIVAPLAMSENALTKNKVKISIVSINQIDKAVYPFQVEIISYRVTI